MTRVKHAFLSITLPDNKLILDLDMAYGMYVHGMMATVENRIYRIPSVWILATLPNTIVNIQAETAAAVSLAKIP
jgi:hypothetical protein